MNTIKFEYHEPRIPNYSCNKPGDHSGEYVPLSVAVTMLTVLEEIDECAVYCLDYAAPEGLHDRIKAAIAKARG